ncbi:MAG: hypothetical protein DWQ07_04795 [Chloroflexi bacterium]|nr:MAG: hypothetical protein DWQ07_04795 [Chloroflexota bacterium]MBL1194749.1 hypothetical protein [Chloroflexota bacterium]NOH12041.1 hypothetical protein [Chloroflexota bacterium]
MRKHRRPPTQRLLGSFLVLTLVHTACFGTSGVNDGQAIENARLTLEAGLTQNAPAADPAQVQQEGQQVEEPQAEATQTETPVADVVQGAATGTFTATVANGNPTVSVSTATNCRSGPGAPYAINGALSPGQTANVTAQTSVNNYVLIQNPGGGPDCWLWLQHATVNGDISSLAVVTPPASPTPTLTATLAFTQTPTPTTVAPINWTGSWTMILGEPFTVNVTQSGNSINGLWTSGASTISFSGTVSNNGTTVNGSFDVNAAAVLNGNFIWQMLPGSTDQFNGNIQQVSPAQYNGLAWCGWRNGAGQPNPCLGP